MLLAGMLVALVEFPPQEAPSLTVEAPDSPCEGDLDALCLNELVAWRTLGVANDAIHADLVR
jgi:hypothetical protein